MTIITPAQCRAARGLLGLTQAEVAKVSGVSLRTIAHFEAGERRPISANLKAIQQMLEKSGVRFIAENGGGAGVRLLKRSDEEGEVRKRARRSR